MMTEARCVAPRRMPYSALKLLLRIREDDSEEFQAKSGCSRKSGAWL